MGVTMSAKRARWSIRARAQICGADARRATSSTKLRRRSALDLRRELRLFFSVGDAADCGRASRSMASMLSLVLGFAPKQQTTLEFFGHEWC